MQLGDEAIKRVDECVPQEEMKEQSVVPKKNTFMKEEKKPMGLMDLDESSSEAFEYKPPIEPYDQMKVASNPGFM